MIAAILSAAMSSLSSGMNSSSAVIVTDFIGRFGVRRNMEHHDQVRLARIVSRHRGSDRHRPEHGRRRTGTRTCWICATKVVNLLTAPIFVLFFLALFVRWSTPLGAVAATVASISVAVSIAFFKSLRLELLWTSPCSLRSASWSGCWSA